MTTQNLINEFKQADRKVTELENNLEMDCTSYVQTAIETEEYKLALANSQKLYFELESLGIDPYAE